MKAIWKLILKFEDDGTLPGEWAVSACASLADIRAAAGEARAMEELLRKIEWCWDTGAEMSACPSCYCWQRDGHASDCAFAAALDRGRLDK